MEHRKGEEETQNVRIPQVCYSGGRRNSIYPKER
jgi:hypothetical protein